MKYDSLGGRRHWGMLVDEATRCKHSFFLKKKSDQVDMVISWLKGLKNKYKIQVKFIRCDNAGENKKVVKSMIQKDWALFLNIQQQGPLNRIPMWREPFQL